MKLFQLVTVAALGALLIGCGSDNNSSPDRPHPVPVSDFHADADQLCLDAAVDEEEIRRDGGEQITLADRARQLVDLGPIRVQLGADLGSLERPEGMEASAAALARAARARGDASVKAGDLFESGAPNKEISRQATAEHNQRLRLVEAARDLDLEECAERLDPDSREEIVDAVNEAFLGEKSDDRCDRLSERLLTQDYGDKENCVAQGEVLGLGSAASVKLTELQGIADVFAVGRVSISGANGPVTERRVRLTFERGRYRLDKIV